MADLARYAADVGLVSAISANMADLSRYAADVGLVSAISANMADLIAPICSRRRPGVGHIVKYG